MKPQIHFILDKDKNVVPATLQEWGKFRENSGDERIVKQTCVNNKFISTVFIGLDHGYPEFSSNPDTYKPLIFETMVFKSKSNYEEIYCTRYSTWQEAEEGHEIAIQWVKDGCKKER